MSPYTPEGVVCERDRAVDQDGGWLSFVTLAPGWGTLLAPPALALGAPETEIKEEECKLWPKPGGGQPPSWGVMMQP